MQEKMEKMVRLLDKKKQTIATMESCTGGSLVGAITNIEGASDVLHYSAVTYANEFKIKMGVPQEVIDTYTVYSMETAKEMSKHICLFASSTYGIGITGMLNSVDPANPSKNPNKVYISIYDKTKEQYYTTAINVFHKNRVKNKNEVVKKVVEMLLFILEDVD
ncbi:MAG: CinA family protein [bacterium]|nr:CinA family protein [bacterium]